MTAFSQRDPRWAADRLGASTAEYPRPYTIAQAGCLVTAAASMLCDFGVPTDPGRLNRWLRDHNGYADGCLFRFYAVAGLGADLQSLTGAPPRDHITAALADSAAVLAELTPYDDHHRRHWIRITAPFPADWTIMDPWQLPGAELTTLSAAWPCATITRAAVYKPNPARVIPLALTAAGPVQSTPSICAKADGVGRWDPNPGGN